MMVYWLLIAYALAANPGTAGVSACFGNRRAVMGKTIWIVL
jgi:hypothetical protein